MSSVPGTIEAGLDVIGLGIIGVGDRDIGLGIIGVGDRDIGLGSETPDSTFVNSGRGEFRTTSVIFSVSRGVSISTISPCLLTYNTVGTPDTDFFSESGVF
jgi:hypothetical protein